MAMKLAVSPVEHSIEKPAPRKIRDDRHAFMILRKDNTPIDNAWKYKAGEKYEVDPFELIKGSGGELYVTNGHIINISPDDALREAYKQNHLFRWLPPDHAVRLKVVKVRVTKGTPAYSLADSSYFYVPTIEIDSLDPITKEDCNAGGWSYPVQT
jgi:hypothetical protein